MLMTTTASANEPQPPRWGNDAMAHLAASEADEEYHVREAVRIDSRLVFPKIR